MTASPGSRLTNLKWLRMVAMIALLALIAAACGSDDADVTEETTDEVTTPADDETEDETETETEDAATETEEDETETEAPTGDGEALAMAYLLPETGRLAFLGPPIIAGFNLAIEEINEAGGTNGAEVTSGGGDEGESDGTIANQTVDRLLADDVNVIIGAASSGTSLTVIDKITGAGVVQCSPSNTSPTFTNIEDDGLYFRAAPTDALQGPVLAEQLVAAGGTNVAVLALADDYGQGLLAATEDALTEAGATIAVATTYDPAAQSFDAEVQQIVESGADAVALISFNEGARILQTMIERGVGPQDLIVFGADGLAGNAIPLDTAPNNPQVLVGMRTTSPTPASDVDFNDALSASTPGLSDTLFAAEGYDCTIAAALAAHAGGANTSEAVAENMVAVTGAPGTKCTTFAECKDLLDDGEEIDYDGPSGPMDFTDAGEPSQGTYALQEFQEAGDECPENDDTGEPFEVCLVTIEQITSSL